MVGDATQNFLSEPVPLRTTPKANCTHDLNLPMPKSERAYRPWLLAKTWPHIVGFCKVIAMLVPLIALAIDAPIIEHELWRKDPTFAWLIGWHLTTELWCLGFILLDRFSSKFRARETSVTLFAVGTLMLSTWFGLVSWLIYRDLSVYAVGCVFTATVVSTPSVVRRPLYFLAAAVLAGFIALHRSPEMGALFPLVVNPAAVAVICLQLDRFTSAQNHELFEEKRRVQAEHDRADEVLFNVLPASIAEELKRENSVKAVKFERMGILFADIVGFTQFSKSLPPDALVLILNQIFSSFDELVGQLGLEKIKTIGDAYMAISTPGSADSTDLSSLAQLALGMLRTMHSYNTVNGTDLQIRIGLNVGPAVAGVIGVKRFLYDVWGDTVNVASRMESSGLPGRIHVSESIRDLLFCDFAFEARDKLEIKGRGTMQTYFLLDAKPPV